MLVRLEIDTTYMHVIAKYLPSYWKAITWGNIIPLADLAALVMITNGYFRFSASDFANDTLLRLSA